MIAVEDTHVKIPPAEMVEGQWYVWHHTALPKVALPALKTSRPLHVILDNQSSNPQTWDFLPSDYAGDRAWVTACKSQPPLPKDFWLEKLSALLNSSCPSLTSGSDPEIFVEDSSGRVIPAWEFLPPQGVTRSNPLFWDGVQAEFTVPYAVCQDEFARNIRARLTELAGKLPKGAKLSSKSVVEVGEDILASARQEHIAFGCSPSRNAYGLSGLAVPDPRELGIRFAGGHIVYGCDAHWRNELACTEAVKFMDATVGLLGVSLAEGMDDPRRRLYYGLAGEHRLPSYGLEYRTLSNFWLVTGPAVYHLVFNAARQACRLGLGGWRSKFQTISESDVVMAINSTSSSLARELMQEMRPYWEKFWSFNYGLTKGIELLFKPLSEWPGESISPSNTLSNWTTWGWSASEPPNAGKYPQQFRTYLKINQAAL